MKQVLWELRRSQSGSPGGLAVREPPSNPALAFLLPRGVHFQPALNTRQNFSIQEMGARAGHKKPTRLTGGTHAAFMAEGSLVKATWAGF